jgi:hypothetical protein
MSGVLKITKYHLLTLFRTQISIYVAVLLLNVVISIVVTRLVTARSPETNATAGSLDPVALIWIFILGILFFPVSFKFMLAHGISRKRFFLAGIFSVAIMAVIWALVVALFIVISRRFTSIWAVYELLYRNLSFVSLVVWEFAALFLLAVLGWFIYVIYYVSNRKTQFAISAVPFVIGPLLALFNVLTDGRLFHSIGRFFINVMGFASDVPDPYVSIASMLILAIILSGGIFLLVRRAQIRY